MPTSVSAKLIDAAIARQQRAIQQYREEITACEQNIQQLEQLRTAPQALELLVSLLPPAHKLQRSRRLQAIKHYYQSRQNTWARISAVAEGTGIPFATVQKYLRVRYADFFSQRLIGTRTEYRLKPDAAADPAVPSAAEKSQTAADPQPTRGE